MATIKSIAQSKGITTLAAGVCAKFETALKNFAKCHQGYSGGSMNDAAIDQLGWFCSFNVLLK